MKMLSKRALALMAIVLFAATAATAATAFAADKKRLRPMQSAIESVNTMSQAQLRNKARNLQKFRTAAIVVKVRS